MPTIPKKIHRQKFLHTVLLGIAKYLVRDLVKLVLSKPETRQLNAALKQYKMSEGFSRQFNKEITHCGSYLGRDFKILVQILPIILSHVFQNSSDNLQRMIACICRLGKLCSLLFVRQVTRGFSRYVNEVDAAAKDLITCLHDYDEKCTLQDHKKYTLKPKVHFLTHLAEDITRFGTALNFETE
ncbi:hypothetical protein EDC96DRAFT_453931, partial [Choanephora cucurbitarum]